MLSHRSLSLLSTNTSHRRQEQKDLVENVEEINRKSTEMKILLNVIQMRMQLTCSLIQLSSATEDQHGMATAFHNKHRI